MNHTDKAISAVRRIDKRIADLEQQLTMTGQEVQAAEAEKLDGEILNIHKEAQRMLDKLAALMEVEVFPISILFGRTVTPVDRRNLDPDALPMDFIQLTPKTVEMRRRYWNLHAEAKRLEDPVEARRAAQRLLGEEAA